MLNTLIFKKDLFLSMISGSLDPGLVSLAWPQSFPSLEPGMKVEHNEHNNAHALHLSHYFFIFGLNPS